ncbi:hypothetical protein BY458DRAFT_316825 [Sporodiniella umbellata]|nr:hypothetical protein BY458DRAFT_316825 [Sporodiniella umbellata]
MAEQRTFVFRNAFPSHAKAKEQLSHPNAASSGADVVQPTASKSDPTLEKKGLSQDGVTCSEKEEPHAHLPKTILPQWSSEETQSLIKAIQRLPLAVPKDSLPAAAWEDVLKQFNMDKSFQRSKKACQDKWHSLVQQYQEAVASLKHQGKTEFVFFRELQPLLDERVERASPPVKHSEQARGAAERSQVQTRQATAEPAVIQSAHGSIYPPISPPTLMAPAALAAPPYVPLPQSQYIMYHHPHHGSVAPPASVQAPNASLNMGEKKKRQSRATTQQDSESSSDARATHKKRSSNTFIHVHPQKEERSPPKRKRTTEELLETILLKQEELISVVREQSELERQSQYQRRAQHQEFVSLLTEFADKARKL